MRGQDGGVSFFYTPACRLSPLYPEPREQCSGSEDLPQPSQPGTHLYPSTLSLPSCQQGLEGVPTLASLPGEPRLLARTFTPPPHPPPPPGSARSPRYTKRGDGPFRRARLLTAPIPLPLEELAWDPPEAPACSFSPYIPPSAQSPNPAPKLREGPALSARDLIGPLLITLGAPRQPGPTGSGGDEGGSGVAGLFSV